MPQKKYVNKKAMAKRRFRRKKQSVANKALAIAKKNRASINKTIEKKHLNYSLVGQSINSAGYAAGSFLPMAAGVGDDGQLTNAQRIGNSINLLRQRVGMNFIVSGTDTFNQMRVLVVESLEGNQSLALSDVLEYSSYATHGDLVFVSPWKTNPNDNKKYKVHLDKTFELSAITNQGSSGYGTKQIDYTITYKNGGKQILYPTATSTSDAPSNHRISVLCISDSASVTHPSLSYFIRSTYLDA